MYNKACKCCNYAHFQGDAYVDECIQFDLYDLCRGQVGLMALKILKASDAFFSF